MSGVLETNAEVDSAVKPEEAKGIKSFQTGKKHFHNIMPTRGGQFRKLKVSRNLLGNLAIKSTLHR